MADPSYDDARDVRAALGALLVDEPALRAPVADDVARGRALLRRRRLRAGTGAALAAVLVLVVGAGGLLRDADAPATGPSVTSPSPTDPGPRVSALLAGIGWVVDAMVVQKVPSGAPSMTTWTVHPLSSPGPLSAQLMVRVWSDRQWGAGGTSPEGSVLASCSTTGACGVVSSTVSDCIAAARPCWSTRSTTFRTSSESLPRGTFVLLAYDDRVRQAVEAVATPADCLTCAATAQPEAFLTFAQLSRVVSVLESAIAPSPSASDQPASLQPCRAGEVKIIAGEGSPTETVGSSGIWVEVHARNPGVDCILRGRPTLELVGGDGNPLVVSSADGIYQAADFPDAAVEVSQALGPARFALTTARCDVAQSGFATLAVVRLPGDGTAVPVELVAVSRQLGTCPGATGAAGAVVFVSRFTR